MFKCGSLILRSSSLLALVSWNQSASLLVLTKAGNYCCRLSLEATEDDEEATAGYRLQALYQMDMVEQIGEAFHQESGCFSHVITFNCCLFCPVFRHLVWNWEAPSSVWERNVYPGHVQSSGQWDHPCSQLGAAVRPKQPCCFKYKDEVWWRCI